MKDPIRNKSVPDTPEERVRQALIVYLHTNLHIPKGLMSIEKGLIHQGEVKRADLVIYDKKGSAWMVIECKAPQIKLTQSALDQVARYNQYYHAPYVLVTNGSTHFCARVENDSITFLSDLPSWE